MTLLNSIALFATCAIVVPIVVHLRKRRKSTIVDWPAMQFLSKTLASRRRGLTLEEFLLLLLRCLIVLLFVLAMARPVIPAGQIFRWSVVVLSLMAGLASLVTGFTAAKTRIRKTLAFVIAALMMIAAVSFMNSRTAPFDGWASDRDVAIVIDGSSTMADTEHFEQAVQKATKLVRQLSGESTVSIILAGPVPQTIAGSPFHNLRSAEQRLGKLRPTHGGNDLGQAIELAKTAVLKGKNDRKQVVVFTDNQLRTWESVADAAPTVPVVTQAAAEPQNNQSDSASSAEKKPADRTIHFAAHVAPLPENASNISVNSVIVKSSVPTINRPIPCEVEVTNHGTKTIRDIPLSLIVDGNPAATENIPQLEQGATRTVRFTPTISNAGSRVIEAKVTVDDAMPDDDAAASVVTVISRISILVLNGNTFANKTEQSATFAQLALDPQSLKQPDSGDAPGNDASIKSRPIQIRTVDINDLTSIEQLDEFAVVLLCDVPRLNKESSDRLTRYVQNGGRLWIVPQESADVDFYNNWAFVDESTKEPNAVLPCQLLEHSTLASDKGADDSADLSLASETSSIPWMKELFERGEHDLFELKVSSYWKLKPHGTSVIPLKLSSDDPLFVEHTVGKGQVLIQAIPLTANSSNLISRVSFPVLMHLWAQSLATGKLPVLNIAPTANATIELTRSDDETTAESMPTNLTIISPNSDNGDTGATQCPVEVAWTNGAGLIDAGATISPGVYHVIDLDSSKPLQSFSVLRDAGESDLSIASEAKRNELAASPGFQWFQEIDELTSPGITTDGGREIWKLLAFMVLWLLAAESLLIRWIRSRRRVQPSSPTGFTPVETGFCTTCVDVPFASSVVQKAGLHRDEPGGGVSTKPTTIASLSAQGGIP
ncbi:MAG: VWA domain-containing protein [Planctomycetaceae bacterium]|nr:VWA domain-containing protein [Planctomycetaceae bacterium]